MLIVKPYGRTRTAEDANGRRTRNLHRHLDPDHALDLAEFSVEHDELIIAQWISMIDKVLTKPRNGRRPSDLQRWARAELGAAAFAIIEDEDLLPGLSTRRTPLLQLWEKKLHPYGAAVVPARDLDRAKREVKGRWYTRFAGDFDPTRLVGPIVAERLYSDLYLREARIEPTAPDKRAGRIPARAASISANVARPADSSLWDEAEWSEHDWQRYCHVDVAAGIRRAVAVAVQARRTVGIRLPAAILHSHYARLFMEADGKPQKLSAAREAEPGLLLLHLEVRATYRALLEGRKSDPVRNLPSNSSQLRSLILQRRRNRRLAALVRLGKVVHYQASNTMAADQTGKVVASWPKEVTHSRFWLSEAQAQIKRNEAFVRIWRGAIAIATRTVSDWADPAGHIEDDLLLAMNIKTVTQGRFDEAAFSRKVALLFGNQSDLLLSGNSQDHQDLLQFALQGLASIRNGAFHFKGRGGFAATLSKPHPEPRGATARSVQDLWHRDRSGRAGRLKQLLRTLHCETMLDQERLARLYATLSSIAADHTPLPRFRRVLLRAQNAWRKEPWRLALPDLPNRADLQDPARLHQYGTLKLLYERSFPTWLADRDWSWLNELVDRAVDRASAAAKFINRDQSASARASGKLRLSPGETIDTLLDRLAAETATEFRIQRGYDQDADNARAQASYLDHLRCDIIAQAFQYWLEEAGFDHLLELPADGGVPPSSNLDLVAEPSNEIHADPWVHRLYFLVHLIPVDDVAQLLHQLRKWRALEGGATGDSLIVEEVFGLYLDMHDAKFEGGSETLGTDALANLFERRGDFESLLAGQSVEHQFVPWRGLREMLRFGNLTYMMPALERACIRSRDVADLCWAEAGNDGPSPIAAAQDYRERLHARWIAQKGLSPPERFAYAQQLDLVVWHRHLAARVRLHDHLRAHRLLIRVLGRMIDFAGLWERDLYFVTLALIHQAGATPAAVISDTKLLQQGRIIPAIRAIRGDAIGSSIRSRLNELFGDLFTPKSPLIATRNELAHFQPLRETSMPDLTAVVNKTRALMVYDRKLANAVSQSVIEMLNREGLELRWKTQDHQLASAELQTRQVQHLRTSSIRENLHGRTFVEMVATLFAGVARPREDVTTINPARIEPPTSRSVTRPNVGYRVRSPAGRVNR